ncbi:hypothetical protein ACYUJ6_00355 [Clostridium sp. JNZ X4-2]
MTFLLCKAVCIVVSGLAGTQQGKEEKSVPAITGRIEIHSKWQLYSDEKPASIP